MYDLIEASGRLVKGQEPPWVRSPSPMPFDQLFAHLKNAGLVKLDEASDIGHASFSPSIALMKRLVLARLRQLAARYGSASEIETPLLYRTTAKGVSEEAGRFFDEMYHVGSKDEPSKFVIRPGGDFGAFKYFRDQSANGRELPIRIFEAGPVMRRLRRSGVKSLWSLRAFTLLDLHTLCSVSDHWSEYTKIIQGQRKALHTMGFQGDIVFDLVPGAFDELASRIADLARFLEQDIFVKHLPEKRNYWLCQHRFFDNTGEGLMDGQLDFENPTNYEISGPSSSPILAICHGSFGSVERWLWRHLSRSMESGSGLEEWLCPVQLRFLPMSPSSLDLAAQLCQGLADRRIRTDIDSSTRSLSRRIKRAFDGYCGAVVVIGDEETLDKKQPVKFRRADGTVETAHLDVWVENHIARNSAFPFEHTYARQ